MNTYSLSQWVSNEFLNSDPKHIFTAVCLCKKCDKKKFVKFPTAQLPSYALEAGFADDITPKQFENLLHFIVQKNG